MPSNDEHLENVGSEDRRIIEHLRNSVLQTRVLIARSYATIHESQDMLFIAHLIESARLGPQNPD